MEAGEFGTVRDLAIAVNLAERHVSRQLRLAYLAPEVLRRLTCGRETPAITLMVLTECAVLPWARQNKAVFDGALVLELIWQPKADCLHSAALRVCIVFRYQLKLRKGRLLENVNTLKTQLFLNAPF